MALMSLYFITIMTTEVSAMELSIIERSLIDNKREFNFIDYIILSETSMCILPCRGYERSYMVFLVFMVIGARHMPRHWLLACMVHHPLMATV
jgi:hypothetical protein